MSQEASPQTLSKNEGSVYAHPVHHAGRVRKRLLSRVQEGPLRLVRGRIAQDFAGCAPIPEIAAGKQTALVLVEDGAQCRISRAGRFAIAEPAWDGTLVNGPDRVGDRFGAGPARFRAVATGAGLVLIDRKILVKKYGLPEKFHIGQFGSDAQ